MKISESNIIITGAASGFGRAMAIDLTRIGASIFAIDKNSEALYSLKMEEPKISTFTCDVTDNKSVEEVIDKIFLLNNRINVLINNAGIMKNAPLVNLLKRPDTRHSIELWSQVIDVNLNAVFYMTRSVVDKMIRNRSKGVIINISSIAARGNAGQTAYTASKAAVEAMSKVWAKELGSFGIRSVSVAPGFINTIGAHDALEEKMLNNWIDKTPLKRTGEVDEIVSTIEYVISNDFFNGETVSLNGGLVI